MLPVNEVKARVTIEQVLSEKGIHLRRGRCCCPLHGGDNPTSFCVRDGVFHCFACGESGDVVSLVQKLHGWDFKQAIRHLGQKTGISEADFAKPVPPKTELPEMHKEHHSEKEGEEDRILDALIRLWTKTLRQLDEHLKHRKISLSEYYADQQWAEYQLSRLDELSILRNYERNMQRKERWKKPR